MLTEEAHADGVADKTVSHEEAAHEKRNWVRLTYDCNNRCVFCLDSETHDGEIRDANEVRDQIVDGRRKGATRLILSGGEPTMHPRYVDFIALGRKAGYRKIQTVTNGRMFSYPEFLQKCLDAGLSEITFSIHGPNARIHDALVGCKGAYEEEIRGLDCAIAERAKRGGTPVVNVDVVINRANVKHLGEMLRGLYARGVKEFDLLQVVPFGRAFTEGRDTLFYDLTEARPHLLEALAFSELPDVHVWMNRFPPAHLEGYEHLIQDPYKLNDEVRGRKEEFARLLGEGVQLDCRDPKRCRYCYLEKLCDTLESVRTTQREARFEALRIDTAWEAAQPPVFGGDPASARRARDAARSDGRVGLPLVMHAEPALVPVEPVEKLAERAGAKVLELHAASIAEALGMLAGLPQVTELELHLADDAGLADGDLGGRRIVRAVAKDAAQAERLLAVKSVEEVVVSLTRATGAWLLARSDFARLAVRQPSYERLTEAREEDVDFGAFFGALPAHVPVEDAPACLARRTPRARPSTFDAAMASRDGRLEIFRYTRRYVAEHYRVKSLRCAGCVHDSQCAGVHVNTARAHGFAILEPVRADAE